ncbi:hypothetical protein BJH90_07760 [Bacillus halotolerans]|uniref:hypothetical protein n=1 Tax=Bacillus halotolerans TaxID=260554 RepID=UPI0003A8F455|nr:hypothetical protein [Bacillus halotolerans]PON01399.1 hypothetical protein BJH90_07760 [Bacillus halotolerans]
MTFVFEWFMFHVDDGVYAVEVEGEVHGFFVWRLYLTISVILIEQKCLTSLKTARREKQTDFRLKTLTHQAVDHIGGVPEMLSETGHQIKVYVDGLERPYMRRGASR